MVKVVRVILGDEGREQNGGLFFFCTQMSEKQSMCVYVQPGYRWDLFCQP